MDHDLVDEIIKKERLNGFFKTWCGQVITSCQ